MEEDNKDKEDMEEDNEEDNEEEEEAEAMGGSSSQAK